MSKILAALIASLFAAGAFAADAKPAVDAASAVKAEKKAEVKAEKKAEVKAAAKKAAPAASAASK
jgi:hypothetical protein